MNDFNFRRMCRLINAFGKVRRGELQEKNFKINTFEAGICMKTNEYLTNCPENIRTFMYLIRTFLSNRYQFCRNSG
jgi:hypothetical protein